jgi:subtilisin-like proprotein convertase family protein
MLHRLSAAALAALLLPACLTSPESDLDNEGFVDGEELVAGDDDNFAVSPYHEMFPNGRVNDLLPKETVSKDGPLPASFLLPLDQQSAVRNQASRGVCSIFATGALVEHLQLKMGRTVDISEQHLQWSAKNEVGDFRQSEGSTNGVNLRAVTGFGTILESEWPYETSPWNTANDAACTGESRPTRCYTNGEPPPAAVAAPRSKLLLASSLLVTPTSIKNHLVENGTAVSIGLDFFYQAWNHGGSDLPINLDAQARGIVTYRNEVDREKSLAKRAGHAVLIVGYDDNFEAPLYDENGDPQLDDQGNPVMERGFYIFKNSWGTGRFGRSNRVDPTTGEGIPAGYGYISQRYVHEEADADVAAIATAAAPAATIPDNSRTGINSAITFGGTELVSSVAVELDITHPYVGDLTVTLTNGTSSFKLHNKSGGAADDIKRVYRTTDNESFRRAFAGKRLSGTWTLSVVDSGAQDVGALNRWAISVIHR